MSFEINAIVSGRYRILALAGRGGMSDVYKVWDSRRSCILALKVLREDYATDPQVHRYFEREAEALQKLNHPNIVRFYEYDEEGGFLVEDFVEGQTLRRLLNSAKGPLAADSAIRIALDVLSALSFAHKEGWVHRDIKPGNIMISKEGRTYVADFGIARIADNASTTALTTGTPAYMPPEQWRGRGVDARTDIYSLGVVLYEMVTGRPPFEGEGDFPAGWTRSERIREQHLRDQPIPPTALNPRLDPALAQVTLHCLAKDPAQRYQTADELSAALRAVAGPVPALVPLVAANDRTELLGRAEKRQSTAAAAGTILAAIAARAKTAPAGIAAISIIVLASMLFTRGPLHPLIDPPTQTPTPTATATLTRTPTVTLTPTATASPTATNTATATFVPTPTGTPSRTHTPTKTATRVFTPTPVYTPTPSYIDTPVPPPMLQWSDYWSDEFNGTTIDTGKWETYANGGNISEQGGSLALTQGKTTLFPLLRPRGSAIPQSGDFRVEIGIQFTAHDWYGSGVKLTDEMPPLWVDSSKTFKGSTYLEIWEDNEGPYFFRIHCYWPPKASNRVYPGTPVYDQNYHSVQLEYSSRRYSLAVDGNHIYTSANETDDRPQYILIGNYAPAPQPGTWSQFKLDYVRVLSR